MSSCSSNLQDVKSLSPTQKSTLKKSNFKELDDVVLTPPGEVARRLKTSLSEAQSIVEIVCAEIARTSLRVDEIGDYTDDKFTTGDAVLDRTVGGGIRTGMVWELAGESASGKTQLALQLCLLVQVRPMLGGLSGSACYLSTHSKLSTKRLNQLILDHPLLSPAVCSLSDIHTVASPTVELLVHTLTSTFPALQNDLRKDSTRKPVRLIIIDSISALFHSSGKSSSASLYERSKALAELSRIMHEIAARDGVAFVVINEVTDVFHDYYPDSQEEASKGDVIYRDQAKWFNSAHSIPAESMKEACLGLVWANQVNVRIMLTRTNRRRHLDDPYPLAKRRQVDDGTTATGRSTTPAGNEGDFGQTILLRRFSVVFSSVASPCSVDFAITSAGVSAVDDETPAEVTTTSDARDSTRRKHGLVKECGADISQLPKAAGTSPNGDSRASQQFINARMVSTVTEAGSSESSAASSLQEVPSTYPEADEFDDDNIYWDELIEMSHDALPDVDFEGLERSQIEEGLQPSQVVVPVDTNG